MRHVVKHFIRTSPYVIYKNQKPYLPNQNPLWLFELSLWSPHWLLCWCFRCGWSAAVCFWTIATDTQNKPPHQGWCMSRRIMRLQHLPVSVWLCLCSCTEKRNCKRVTCLCACVTNTATSLLPSYTGEHKQDTTLCARQSAHRSQTSAVWSWPVCCVKVHFYWTVFELKTPLLLNPKAVCQLSVLFFFSSKIHRVVQSEFNTPGWDC